MHETLARLARWLCTLALLGLLAAHVARAGGFVLRAPATVFSRAFSAQRAQEPLLIFLREVRDHVPAGASIAIHAEGDPNLVYLLALGQLPRQRVVAVPAGEPGAARAARPEYVAAFERRWRGAGYRRVTRLAGGWLYRRAEP